MFSELPKLLGRDFAIGFFLPAALFVAACLGLDRAFPSAFPRLDGVQTDVLGAAALLFATWMWAVLLLALNRSLQRLLEGYGTLNPLRLLAPLEARRLARLTARIERLDRAIQKDPAAARALNAERGALMRRRVKEFPEERHLLPTRFGNILRAFETYPRVMYGLDDIPGWLRLLAVIPRDYRGLVNDAKSMTDFWMNLHVQSFVLMIAYAVAAAVARTIAVPWFPLLCVATGWMALRRARVAALEWGEMVKAAYDVFLPQLRVAMQYPSPAAPAAEEELWTRFSRAVIYRNPADLPARENAPPAALPPSAEDEE